MRRHYQNILVPLIIGFCLMGAKAAEGDLALDDASDPPYFKVLKVHKNTATVVFSRKRSPMKAGQTGRMVPKIATGAEEQIDQPSRRHFLSLDASLSMLNTKSGGTKETPSNSISTSIVYGWNRETLEYGLVLSYSFEKQELVDSKTMELGGLVDYNFNRNRPENDGIFGLRLLATVGQQDNSGQSKAANTMRIEPGVFYKWFGLSTNLAVTGVVGYKMQDVNLDNSKTTISGIVGKLGIETYF